MYIIVKAPKGKLLWGDHGQTCFWSIDGEWTDNLKHARTFESYTAPGDYIVEHLSADHGCDLTVVSLDSVPPWIG